MSIDVVQDFSDELFTFLNKSIVDVAALNQEHVHSDLKWHILTDSLDHLKVLLDLLSELITIIGLLLQELINTLFLAQDEDKWVVDIECFLDDSQVLRDGLVNLFFGLTNDLIILGNMPKMLLVTSLDGVFRSRQVGTLSHNVVDDIFKLSLDFFSCDCKLDLIISGVNIKFECDEVVFVW